MSKFTVLMDMDGVLYPFEEAFNELYVKYGGEPLTFEKWIDFSTMPGNLIGKVWEDPTLFNRRDPYPGALGMMVALNQMDIEMYIVTRPGRCPEVTVPAKIEWVKRWMPWFDLRNFTTMFPKWRFTADMIVDDHPPVVDKWRKQNPNGLPVLYTQPWNLGKVGWMRSRGASIAEEYVDILNSATIWIEEVYERGV